MRNAILLTSMLLNENLKNVTQLVTMIFDLIEERIANKKSFEESFVIDFKDVEKNKKSFEELFFERFIDQVKTMQRIRDVKSHAEL